MNKILRLKDVIDRTRLGRSTIYKLIQLEQFPAPIKLTEYGAAMGFIEQEINDWIETKIARSRQPNTTDDVAKDKQATHESETGTSAFKCKT